MRKNPILIPLNIPNILSLYRLFSFPIVLAVALLGYEKLFVWLICINLVTDVLDGLIARGFKLQTEIGSRIDSIADLGTFLLAFLGLYLFRWEQMKEDWLLFLVLLVLLIFTELFGLIKFGRLPSLHLYSWKIGGYIQGAFLFITFAYQYYPAFFYFVSVWSILAFSEHIIIQSMLTKLQSNAKGLYWVLRNRRKEKEF